MSLGTLSYAPPTELDTGRLVAGYFQASAWISIASTIGSAVFLGDLSIDLSPILLFWAASSLKRRSPSARKCVLAFTGIGLCLAVAMVVWAFVFGTDGMTVSVWVERIRNPAPWQVAVVAIFLIAWLGIPFLILMSGLARRQFTSPRLSAGDIQALATQLAHVR